MASVTTNPLKEAFGEGRTVFGLWSVVPGAFGAELLSGTGGIDYVCVDGQHGLVGYDAMVPMLQAIAAAGSAPIARVSRNDPAEIGKTLDAGAWAVIVPLVNTAEEAARAVAACRYPPNGTRSYGPVRAQATIGSADPRTLEAEAACIVMVETREGLENVEEIAATPGVDGVYVGPTDLAVSLGLAPSLEVTEEEHVRAVGRIREACEKNGIAAGVHCASGDRARRHAEAGFRMVTVSMDATLLTGGAEREVGIARHAVGDGNPGPQRGRS